MGSLTTHSSIQSCRKISASSVWSRPFDSSFWGHLSLGVVGGIRGMEGMGFFQTWDGEVKRCSLVNTALRPDGAAMFAKDTIDCGQADAGAFEFLGAMKPLEDAE